MPREHLPVELARRVRDTAQSRCGYCLGPQGLIMVRLEIEHIIPLSKGGTSDESNLWLCCPLCNRYKGNRTSATDPESGEAVPLFHLRLPRWAAHF